MSFEEFLGIVRREPDSRQYSTILEKNPGFVNQQDAAGMTALMHAAKKGYGDSMETLVRVYNADPTIKDYGRTAADHAKDAFVADPDVYNNDKGVLDIVLKRLKDAEAGTVGARRRRRKTRKTRKHRGRTY